MAKKKRNFRFYDDVMSQIDAMPDDAVDPQIAEQALDEATKEATKNPVSKQQAIDRIGTSQRGKRQGQKQHKKGSKITYRKDVENYLTTQGGKQIVLYRKLFMAGFKNLLAIYPNEKVIARIFGLRENIIDDMKHYGDKGIEKAYDEAKAKLEPLLMAAMFRQALGFEYEETRTTYIPLKSKRGQLTKRKVEKFKKYQPGKPSLLLNLLSHLYPDKWTLKPMSDGGNVHFHITGDVVANQIVDLAGEYLKPVEATECNEIIENDSDAD